jgi:hypothetical protein
MSSGLLTRYGLTVPAGGGGETFWAVTASGWNSAGFTQRLGFRFTVGASDLVVNTLRLYNGSNELTENVRIHRVSDGALIAGSDISGASGVYSTASITEVTLSSGVDYVVSGRAGGTVRNINRNPSSLSFYSGITLVGYVYSTDDNLPSSSTSSDYVSFDFGYVAA